MSKLIIETNKEPKEPRLKDYDIGTLLEFENGTIGIVCSDSYIRPEFTQDEKAIFLLKDSCGDFHGHIADYWLNEFKKGNFKVIGNIDSIEVVR